MRDIGNRRIHHAGDLRDHVAAISCGAWPQEFHVAGTETEYVWLDEGTWYQVPYRSLLVRGVDNLLVAGRCISATHEALASTRVIAPSMADVHEMTGPYLRGLGIGVFVCLVNIAAYGIGSVSLRRLPTVKIRTTNLKPACGPEQE